MHKNKLWIFTITLFFLISTQTSAQDIHEAAKNGNLEQSLRRLEMDYQFSEHTIRFLKSWVLESARR